MTTPSTLPPFIRLVPQYRERVWGGTRLKPDSPVPIGELWAVHEDNQVIGMPGETLGSLTRKFPDEMLGPNRSSDRFPLLIKLLDCHDWLSVQVHPDDAQAIALEGPGHVGKTEAWHVLEAKPGAELIASVRQDTTLADLHGAIDKGAVLDLCQRHLVRAGDNFFIPAGTLHALGPGLLLYEVQQSSELTYRVWDWDRPPSADRTLHIEKSKAVVVAPAQQANPPTSSHLIKDAMVSPFFTMRRIIPSDNGVTTLQKTTLGSLMCLKDAVQIDTLGNTINLAAQESLVIPAWVKQFNIIGSGDCLFAIS